MKTSFKVLKNLKEVFLVLLVCASCQSKKDYQQKIIEGETMGTYYKISLSLATQDAKTHASFSKKNIQSLKADIDQLLIKINQSVSTYIPNSEISIFNKSQSTNWINTSRMFFELSQKAKDISIKSNYFFDPSIAPLVNLWGFGPTSNQHKIPASYSIASAKSYTGIEKIDLAENIVFQIKKNHPMLQMDFSAFAKGYGVDQVSQLLYKQGFEHHLIDIGGEIKVKGFKNAKDLRWRLAIENPKQKDTQQKIFKSLFLHNKALATSGDYRNFFELDGIKYSHTIDPHTGYPTKHSTRSVSVVHELCGDADAYATAFLAMGHPKALDLANSLNIAAFFIVESNGKLKHYSSNTFVDILNTQAIDKHAAKSVKQ